VEKLYRDLGAVFMYCIGQLPETGYQTIIMQAELVPAAQAPFPVHGGHLDYDQAETAPGTRLVVPDQPVGDPAAIRGETASHRWYGEAVFDLQPIDFDGLKKSVVFIRHGALLTRALFPTGGGL
jgi:hypothetical protein